jgi:hypothetical protein
MRPTTLLVIACAIFACAHERPATNTATLTNADATAITPPPAPLRIDPQPSIDRTIPVEEWRARYPQAAHGFDEWKGTYPDAASRFATWSVREPDHLEVLVLWSVTRPHEGIGPFLVEHPGWETLSALAREEPEAVSAFLHWVRACRGAAEELAVHPGGLAYVHRF